MTRTLAILAVGVAAGLIAAPITLAANAADPNPCAAVFDAARQADGKLWRSAQRHDGKPTRHAVKSWRVDSLYVESWARHEGCT